jgi:uncharacterized protein (TIGR03066 family)
MSHCLDWTICVILVTISGNTLADTPDSTKPANPLVGKWKSDEYQTEWGPMRNQLVFTSDGKIEVRIFLIDKTSESESVIVKNGVYRIDKNRITIKGVVEGQWIHSFRFDKQSRLVLRYKNEPEVKYVRLTKNAEKK